MISKKLGGSTKKTSRFTSPLGMKTNMREVERWTSSQVIEDWNI
jgi:hypothetical protein